MRMIIEQIERYGNLASVVGLLVTAGVFVLAARTQRKISEAQTILLDKLNHLEAIWAIANLETLFGELFAFLQGKLWALAADRCKSIIRTLVVVRERSGISAEDRTNITMGIDDIRTIQEAIEAKDKRSDVYHLDSKKRAILEGLSLLVSEIKEKIKGHAKEVPQ